MNLKKGGRKESTDVLVIGGGVAGLQAAIDAKAEGVNVIIVEKADTRRSGNGSTGNDHFLCYIPEVHGGDIDYVLEEIKDTMDGSHQDDIMIETLMLNSELLVKKWHSYGINMMPTGKYNFEGHTLPGRQHYHLKFDGRKQKECLTKEALRQGAVIHNHVTIANLISNEEGRVIGAIGIETSQEEPELIIYEAKAVILATGPSTRTFPGSIPAYMFNTSGCPACAGGAILGYRIGAKLINYDLIGCHAGPKYFIRGGKATWIGMLSDAEGNPAGPFISTPSRKYGDPMSDIWPGVFDDKLKNGTGPVYMNCTMLSTEDLAYMKYCFETEGISSISDYLEQKNINLEKSMIEFGSYTKSFGSGGLDLNIKGETNIKGLYGAGTICGNVRGHVTSAAVFGMISGVNAAKYAKGVEIVSIDNHPIIQETATLYDTFLEREEGGSWQEANAVIQQIMFDYIGGSVRTSSLLKAGLKYIRDLKTMVYDELKCTNAHELMRSIEVLEILDICEIGALMGENRRETRGKNHNRPDYPFTNPLLNQHFQTIELSDGEVKLDFRKNRRRMRIIDGSDKSEQSCKV